MGYSAGEFCDDQGRQWHLEASSGLIIIQNPDEMAPAMRLTFAQASILHRHLRELLRLVLTKEQAEAMTMRAV